MLEEIRYYVIKGVDKSEKTRIFRIVNIFGWTYLLPFKVRKRFTKYSVTAIQSPLYLQYPGQIGTKGELIQILSQTHRLLKVEIVKEQIIC